LTVRDGRVWLKTLDGLQPIDVILRRVDDHLCDPLELRQDFYFEVMPGGLTRVASRPDTPIISAQGISKDKTGLHSLLRAVTHSTKTYPGFVGDGAEARLAAPAAELLSILLDKSRQGSLSFTLQALLYAASSLRERTSPDIKRVFSNLEEDLQVLQVQQQKAPSSPLNDEELLHTVFEGLNHLLTHMQLEYLLTICDSLMAATVLCYKFNPHWSWF